MQLCKINEITIDSGESIRTATLSGSNEIVILLSSGIVISYNIVEQKRKHLFSVHSDTGYPDGGFDIADHSTIYTLDRVVVVVNDFKRHGVIYYPEKGHFTRLWRGEYHADISRFPIALYKDEMGVPHIIYGKDWNHVQIMNLDTLQILTASKSLIEAGAEEEFIEFHQKHSEFTKIPWPTPYNYFFGKLKLSPNNKFFLSEGWAWGSCDSYNAYDVNHFINSDRILEIPICGGDHINRAACWIDESTIAVGYSPYIEGDEGSTAESPELVASRRLPGR